MAMCLASGVKAQFYDSADDICYYVELKDGEMSENSHVLIFNFDGMKAAILDWTNMQSCKPPITTSYVRWVKSKIKENSTYYEDKVETTEYDLEYIGSKTYQYKGSTRSKEDKEDGSSLEYINFTFSYDRNTLTCKWHYWETGWYINDYFGWSTEKRTYKKVDKSFFKVGRSRTPSGTMHE